jgi:hypothetical protein
MRLRQRGALYEPRCEDSTFGQSSDGWGGSIEAFSLEALEGQLSAHAVAQWLIMTV